VILAGIEAALWLFSNPWAAALPPQEPKTIWDTPCAGCIAQWPVTPAAVPLLVLLHGDGETPARLLSKWRPWTVPAGIAVLSLACPATEGCRGSWWRWNGDPQWVVSQVDHFARHHPIDPTRRWLAGWSGGATYIGWNAQAFERTFAALVFHGGGVGPRVPDCADPAAAAYFLVGSANPLHGLVLPLRDHFAACHQDVTWALLPGADHAAEWASLDARGGAIVTWLGRHTRLP
jgi:poly(3-hydroxybutyrate) depolymerase